MCIQSIAKLCCLKRLGYKILNLKYQIGQESRKMKMALFHVLSIICWIWLTLCMSLVSSTTCGTLIGNYDGTRYRIELQPSEFLEQNKNVSVRWFMHPGGQIDTTNKLFSIQDDKKTLYILVLNANTYKTYYVDCYMNAPRHHYTGSNRLEVNQSVLVSAKTTTFAPSTDQTLSGSEMTGTTIIVVSVCAVLIAVIIAATVLLIMRKNMKHRASRLINQEDTSANPQPSDDMASVYDEINPDKVKKSSRKYQQSVPITVPSKRPSQAPLKPFNSDLTLAATQQVEDEYAIIGSNADLETGKPQISCTGTNSLPVDTCVEYSTVVKSNDTSETNKVHVVEYAQVKKVRASTSGQRVSNLSSNGVEGGDTRAFTVTFPGIDCNTISSSLPAIDEEYRQNGPMYSNLAGIPKLQRSQKRKSRVKSRELQMQYAALDHNFLVSPESVRSSNASTGTAEDNQKCQYASIDFERQAFVAPIRKAPSSWYRRKRKQ